MLETDVSKAVFEGNGTTRIFPFSFKVWKTDQIAVSLLSPEGIAASTSPYSVTLDTEHDGGRVTYPSDNSAPLPVGWRLIVLRDMPFTQRDNYISGTRFDPEVLETRLDQDCAERQQLKEGLDRAITVPAGSPKPPEDFAIELLDASKRAVAAAGDAEASADRAQDIADQLPAKADAEIVRIGEEGQKQIDAVVAEGSAQVVVVQEAAEAQIQRAADEADRAEEAADRAWQMAPVARGYYYEAALTARQDYPAGSTMTFPSGLKYKVGMNVLELSVAGTRWYRSLQYDEVGASGTDSSSIVLKETIAKGQQYMLRISYEADIAENASLQAAESARKAKLSEDSARAAEDAAWGAVGAATGYYYEYAQTTTRDYAAEETLPMPSGVTYLVGFGVLEVSVAGTRWYRTYQYDEVGMKSQHSDSILLHSPLKRGTQYLIRVSYQADQAIEMAERAEKAARTAEDAAAKVEASIQPSAGFFYEDVKVADAELASGSVLSLPAPLEYRVGRHTVTLSVAGTEWYDGLQWEEIGTFDEPSSSIKLLAPVHIGQEYRIRVSYRVDPDATRYLLTAGGTMSGAITFPHGELSSDNGANTKGLNLFGGSDGYGVDAGFMARSGDAGTQSGVFKAATKRGTDGHVTELEGTPTEEGKPATLSWGGKPVAHRGGVFVPRSVTNCVTSAPKGVARHDGTVILLHQDVELLVADGVNTDNTLRTIPYIITRDYTFDVAGMPDGEYIGGYSIRIDQIAVILSKDYYIQETQPTATSGSLQLWFDTNRSRYYYSAQGGTGWQQEASQISCALFRYTLAGGKITDWHATWPCRLVKAEDLIDAMSKIQAEIQELKQNILTQEVR